MNLASYRAKTGMPQRACAEWIGVSIRQLVRWENGESTPKPAMMAKIRKLTRGEVTPADWIDEHEQRQRA